MSNINVANPDNLIAKQRFSKELSMISRSRNRRDRRHKFLRALT
jgi:hypothetical protein